MLSWTKARTAMTNLEKIMLLAKHFFWGGEVPGRRIFSRDCEGFMVFSIDLLSCSWVRERGYKCGRK